MLAKLFPLPPSLNQSPKIKNPLKKGSKIQRMKTEGAADRFQDKRIKSRGGE